MGMALNCRASMCWLSSPALTSWHELPAAEAWPPSSELRQTTLRMIIPVVSPGLLLVPSRSFASDLLLVPLRSFVSGGMVSISLVCFHLLSWSWFARWDCCHVYAVAHKR